MNSLTDPKFKAFDSNGDPLSGSKLYTYEEGSATPKTTYSDVDLTTPNTNPVVLNSRGEASIFGNGSYKFVLKDSSDTSIWTVDGVYAASTVTDSSGNIVATSTDAGATAGPYLKLYRNSASPADNDLLGSVLFEGKNDNSERTTYGEVKVKLLDASDGTEDAEMGLWIMKAGTLTEIATVLSTGIDADITSDDGSVVLSTGAVNTAATLVLATEGLQLWDTNDSHKLSIVVGSDLTDNRNLTFTTGDASRTVTLNGDPTLNDWFDQSVKTTASPTFAGVTLNNAGLHLLDTDASHDLIVKPGSNLTADRTLTVTTGDNDRTIDVSGGNLTVSTAVTLDQGVATTSDVQFNTVDVEQTAYGPFKASLASDQVVTTGNDDIIVFDSESGGGGFDLGADFNTTTGKYVAPTAGIYLITFFIQVASATNLAMITLYKNSGTPDEIIEMTGNANQTVYTGSTVLNLGAGDEIYIQVEASGGNVTVQGDGKNSESSISGCMLYKSH